MTYPLYQVDAFTRTPFTGNPAAVCVFSKAETKAADANWMQQVAAEMNLSETAFVYPADNGHFHLRWFTPAIEVPLCGHATLATAHVLWNECKYDKQEPLIFDTMSGELMVHSEDGRITMDFPAAQTRPVHDRNDILQALKISAGEMYQSGEHFLIMVDSIDAVLNIEPDYVALKLIAPRLIIVTAKGDDCDFVSRVFAPAAGIDEDPVTGSAHCILTPFWSERLGKPEFKAKQISQRGGELSLVYQNNNNGDRVLISGHAVTVLKGELYG